MKMLFVLLSIGLSGCAELDPYFDMLDGYMTSREEIRADDECIADPNCEIVRDGYLLTDENGDKIFVRKGP